MWSCVLLTDAAAGSAVDVSGVGVVPVGTGRELMAAVDAVGHHATGHVLVAAPTALAAELAVTATIVAGRWPDLRLARLVSPHAPLAILSALALARATTEWPSFGVALADALLRRSWSGAWTADVSRLVHPAPSLAQHARSLLPGSGFLVRQAPVAGVLGGEPRQIDEADVPPAGVDRVLLAEDGVPPGVLERLAGTPGVTATRRLDVPGSWRSVYGTPRAAQVALLPVQPVDLLGAVSHRCPACGLDQPGAVCPFCHVMGRSLVSIAHPGLGLPGSTAATPAAGVPVAGGAAGVAPPPAAGAAR
jgi:hypothetical protein